MVGLKKILGPYTAQDVYNMSPTSTEFCEIKRKGYVALEELLTDGKISKDDAKRVHDAGIFEDPRLLAVSLLVAFG